MHAIGSPYASVSRRSSARTSRLNDGSRTEDVDLQQSAQETRLVSIHLKNVIAGLNKIHRLLPEIQVFLAVPPRKYWSF